MGRIGSFFKFAVQPKPPIWQMRPRSPSFATFIAIDCAAPNDNREAIFHMRYALTMRRINRETFVIHKVRIGIMQTPG